MLSFWHRRLKDTRRRVNALENVMIPNYQETIKLYKQKLDENDRATTTRMMKVKDMLLKESIAEKKAMEERAEAKFAAGEIG